MYEQQGASRHRVNLEGSGAADPSRAVCESTASFTASQILSDGVPKGIDPGGHFRLHLSPVGHEELRVNRGLFGDDLSGCELTTSEVKVGPVDPVPVVVFPELAPEVDLPEHKFTTDVLPSHER